MIKRSALLFLFNLLLSSLIAQTMGLGGQTRAVVIGISDYQDQRIPDLKFAHRDAGAFVEYLQSVSGGNVVKDNIRHLTNESATAGQIFSALDWLIAESKEGDKVIIYFSGHGDVETKTIRQRGYLLSHDTPANNYRVGAIGLDDINDVVATLSELNKAEVVLVTDACHSGQLAGNEINGTQATAAAMMNQFSNEVKIMSCQPDEFSQEGEQWGGGRGLFSYHLVEGLTGLADRNEDEKITLREIERYLEDEVSREAAPGQQTPLAFGNKMTTLTFVDQKALSALKDAKSNQIETMASVGTRTNSGLALLSADSSGQRLYAAFERALRQKNFLPSDRMRGAFQGPSASELFDTLMRMENLGPLRGTMKRNFAAALQDESQQAIIAYLNTDAEELEKRYQFQLDAYDRHPAYLSKATKLIGEDHYLYKKLKAKSYYFEGLVMRLHAERFGVKDYYQRADSLLQIALTYDDEAAYIHNEMGMIQLSSKQFNAGIPHFNKAMVLSPTWLLPRLNLLTSYLETRNYMKADSIGQTMHLIDQQYANAYVNRAKVYRWKGDKAKEEQIYLEGLEAIPNSPDLHRWLGIYYSNQGKYAKAKFHFEKAMAAEPENPKHPVSLANVYLDSDEFDWRDAFPHLKKAVELDSTYYFAQYNLGYWYVFDGQHEKAIQAFQKAIYLQPGDINAYIYMGYEQMYAKQFLEARQTLDLMEQLFPGDVEVAFGMTCWHALQNQFTEALPYLEQAFQKGIGIERVSEDSDLSSLRETDAYQSMIQRLFPD